MGISSESFSNMSLDDRKIVIGIDFGTTFSGVAWAETRKSDQQFVIESWPATSGSRDGASSVKVPTELRYSPQFEWGFQVPPIVERNQWFKLGLAGKPSGHALSEKQRGAEELTADYLTALCEHLTYTLEQKLGSGILRTIEREYVLTVPAIWSEIAKEKTLKACQQAGLSSKSEILLVSEPEAAATYTLNQLDPHGLKIGDTFVLCDAGGGTVDLISYTIVELYPILKVKEAAAGTGGLCGSTFLNRRFGEYLTSKLGQLPGWDSEILAEAMERFDSVIKKQYSPATSATEGYSILVPGLANNEAVGVRRGRLNMKSSDMKEIFDPVVGKVIDLVKGQIEATKEKVRAVLLVGGFGQNSYLKERLRSSVGSSIEVLQPINAWTAVVRGSVMMGLARANSKLTTVGVVSRAARKHYGIKLKVDFNPNIHRGDLKFWDEKHCRHRVTAMRWFIKKGDAVEENRTHEINFLDHMAVSDGLPKCNSVRVYADEHSPVAPVHQNENVAALVKLQADLSHLTESELAECIKTLADGKQYYCISAAVEVTYHSAYTKYVLLYRGKRYDTVTAEYV